jgi:polysaccharide pyruvyl transferase WcaK-like protein
VGLFCFAYSLKIGQYNPNGSVGVQLRKIKNLHPDFLNDLADCVGNFFSDRKILVFSLQNSLDEAICLKFVKILKTKYNDLNVDIILNSTIDKTISDFSNLEYLIAMRYHACLLGLKFGVKTLPLMYDEKVKILAQEFQIGWADCTKKEDLNEKFENLRNFKPGRSVNREFKWEIFDNFI